MQAAGGKAGDGPRCLAHGVQLGQVLLGPRAVFQQLVHGQRPDVLAGVHPQDVAGNRLGQVLAPDAPGCQVEAPGLQARAAHLLAEGLAEGLRYVITRLDQRVGLGLQQGLA
ncbi:hypothetical protein FQZ97_1077390 [compost metagenome]